MPLGALRGRPAADAAVPGGFPLRDTNRTGALLCVLLFATAPLLAALAATPAAAIIISTSPPPPGWQPVQVLRPSAPNFITPVAASSDGSFRVLAEAVWDSSASKWNLTARMETDHSWSSRSIEWGQPYFSSVTALATDSSDRAGIIASRTTTTSATWVVNVSFISATHTLVGPVTVSSTPAPTTPTVAASPDGSVMVAWMDYTSPDRLFANHSSAGGGWDGAVPLVGGNDSVLDFALAPVGEDGFLLVYRVANVSSYDTFARRYTAGSGWAAAERISTSNGSVFPLALGGSATAGRAALAYWTFGNDTANLTLHTYDTTGGWAEPSILDTAPTAGLFLSDPSVAVDVSGTTHVLSGRGSYASDMSNLSVITVAPSGARDTSWTYRAARLDVLRLAGSGDGFLAVTWTDALPGGPPAARLSRFVPGSGWRPAERLDVPFSPGHAAYLPSGAVSSGGDYVGVWLNLESTSDQLLAHEFVAGNDPPEITVSRPTEGAHVDEASVQVEGRVTGNATVDVGGAQAAVAADGSFSVRVALVAGLNALRVHAVDEWNNPADTWVNVTFDDPLPALADELAGVQADLADTQANLSAAQDDLAETQANLSAAKDDLAATQANLSAAEGGLADAQAALDAQTARANSADANASDVKRQLADANARMDDLEAQLATTRDDLTGTQDTNAGLASQAATATLVAFIALFAGIAGIGVSMVMARRGAGAVPPSGDHVSPSEEKRDR